MVREIYPKKVNVGGILKIQIHCHLKTFTKHSSHLTTPYLHTYRGHWGLQNGPCFHRVHHFIHDLMTAWIAKQYQVVRTAQVTWERPPPSLGGTGGGLRCSLKSSLEVGLLRSDTHVSTPVCQNHLVAKVRSLSPKSPFCIYIQRWHKHLKKTYSCVGTENNLSLFAKIRNVFKHMILSLYTQTSPDLHLFICLFAEEI